MGERKRKCLCYPPNKEKSGRDIKTRAGWLFFGVVVVVVVVVVLFCF